MRTFTTRDEAIEQTIITAIEAGDASAEDFDIDAIADEVLGDCEDGYAQIVDEDEFWDIVAKHTLEELNTEKVTAPRSTENGGIAEDTFWIAYDDSTLAYYGAQSDRIQRASGYGALKRDALESARTGGNWINTSTRSHHFDERA